MEKIYLTNNAIVTIDSIRRDSVRYKARICEAIENVAFLCDMIGSMDEGASGEVKGSAWDVAATLAEYAGVIDAMADSKGRILFTDVKAQEP